jgi:hypothetical protein
LGREQFKEQMLELMEGKLGESHSRELHRETAEQRANRIIAEALARRGGPEFDWATRRRSDPGKRASTARLRSETTLPIKWIAARVQIGTAKGAKSVLPHPAQSQDQRKTARALEACAQLEFQSTVFTVKAHLHGIFTKLNVLSRTEAIAAASHRALMQL